MNASYDGGRVTTRPFRTHGSRLRVNTKADFGKLWAEVLDAENRPVPGFTRDQCEPVHADAIDQAVRWKSNGSFADFRGRPIRLKFYLENVRLYAYRIV